MIENLKLYLGITGTDKDALLSLIIGMAQDAIKAYCCIAAVPVMLDSAVIKLSAYLYAKRNSDGVSQSSQGSRSKTIQNDIPDDIKSMLMPYRRIRVM